MENTAKTIKCPYCGEEISANAKKCKHCKEWLKDNMSENEEPIAMEYYTHEPSTFTKILQLYWITPKRARLKHFKVENGVITIECMNGNSLQAPIQECKFTCVENEYRHSVEIKHGVQKVRFQDIPGMLSDEEWEMIVDFCSNADKSSHIGLKTLGTIRNIVRELK